MASLILSNGYSFDVEQLDKNIRLIVYQNGIEYVCRKETLSKFNRFLQSGEGHAFKGRLQLHHDGSIISIIVKGKVVGEVPAAALTQLINLIQPA